MKIEILPQVVHLLLSRISPQQLALQDLPYCLPINTRNEIKRNVIYQLKEIGIKFDHFYFVCMTARCKFDEK